MKKPWGLCTSFTNFSNKVCTSKHYDHKNRLIKQKENGVDNITHTTSYTYDLNDRPIQKIDTFNNTTQYEYDHITHRITNTTSPPIMSEGQILSVTTTSTYDAFGRETTKTDATGNRTTFCYNAYGSPTEIIYADGGKQSFRYTPGGRLQSQIDQDGLNVVYSYDALGRVILKSWFSSGELITKETYSYDGFNLLQKTDKAGNVTVYAYDGAGRLTREIFAGKGIRYDYDSLGRVWRIVKENELNTLCTIYKYDLLNRVLEKTHTDLTGTTLSNILYSYDADGNMATIEQNIVSVNFSHLFTIQPNW